MARQFNGRFWVKRDKKRNRAGAARAFAEVEGAARQLQHRELMAQQLAESIDRKHTLALAMNVAFDEDREDWERFVETVEAGGGIEPPTSSL